MLKVLSDNVDGNISSICHHIAECNEDELVSATED